jgi:hypothetical protein
MKNITAKAALNLKENPVTLYVHGSILTEHSDDKVQINLSQFPGFNPSILLLDLEIKSGNKPLKFSPKHFHIEYNDQHAKDIKEVTINYGEEKPYTINAIIVS